MDIEISASGFLKEHLDKGLPLSQEEWAGKELAALLSALPLPPAIAYVPLVNGERQPKSYLLRKGDRVQIVPLLTGG